MVIADGLEYIRSSNDQFDVIIVDSTDPIGPGEVLFTEDFYGLAKERLTAGGVIVTQNGVAFFQPDEVTTTYRRLQKHFTNPRFYCAAVPTYYGGVMTFGWATDNVGLRDVAPDTLEQRFTAAGLMTRYYNPGIHRAAFALPQYIQELLTLDAGEDA